MTGNRQLDAGDQLRAIFDYEVRDGSSGGSVLADGKRIGATEQFFFEDNDVADLINDFDWD